ncbi:unnamed protein product [Amoebophrya sp. A120]|nr:unnamed protein product [Amoebophrya sp. A120]|eukprot:GSA120T00013496001.1
MTVFREVEVAGNPPWGEECDPVREKTMPCGLPECPVDCRLSEWTPMFPDCAPSCGDDRTRTRNRVVEQPMLHGGRTCAEVDQSGNSGALQEVTDCPVLGCPVDCVMSDWTTTGCSKTCGQGTETFTRTVVVPDANGGTACGQPTNTTTCFLRHCPVDCDLGPWRNQPDTDCTETCGDAGLQSQIRDIQTDPLHGGASCAEVDPFSLDGSTTRDVPCNREPCPIHCVVTEWFDTSDCTLSCNGGQKMQRRNITTPADHGGTACPTLLEQQVACNNQPCPVDCQMSDWKLNETIVPQCSKTCGSDGTAEQYRTVAIAPDYGGAACPNETTRQINCRAVNPPLVPEHCPIPCVLAEEWTDVGDCDADCGGGLQQQEREILQAPDYGAPPCPVPRTRAVECNLQECNVDCQMSDWANAEGAECSASCTDTLNPNSPVIRQVRTILQSPSGVGQTCGKTERFVPCNENTFCAIDCIMNEWLPAATLPLVDPSDAYQEITEPGVCSSSCGNGTFVQRRTVQQAMAHNGAACPTERERTLECNKQPCPVDCELGEFLPNTAQHPCTTTCGGGTQKYVREVVKEAQHGGDDSCKDQEMELVVPCAMQECPIDCVLGDWQQLNDGQCSTSCGFVGRLSYTRTKQVEANGGASCAKVAETVDQADNADPSISINTDLTMKSTDCSAEDRKPCPVDCVLSEEYDPNTLTECTKTCGGGTRMWYKTRLVDPLNGGQECDDSEEQVRPCNEQNCPRDCELSDWQDEGACSLSCGTGQQKRVRGIEVGPANEGAACETDPSLDENDPAADEPWLAKFVACKTDPCPIDCVVSEWAVQGNEECNPTCAGGLKLKIREHVTEAKFGGAACSEFPTQETVSCNLPACPRDCEVGDWVIPGNEDCKRNGVPVDCGAGATKTKTRQVTNGGAENGGAVCPDLEAEVDCVLNDCPIDCEQTEWFKVGNCTKSCGDFGQQTWKRNTTTQPNEFGTQCEKHQEQRPCNRHIHCPVDCVQGAWYKVGACSVSCADRGEGVEDLDVTFQLEKRDTEVESEYKGASCGDDSRRVPCGPEITACPVDCLLSEWSTGDACTADCGGGTVTNRKTILRDPANGGAQCDDLVRPRPCNTDHCPVNCEMSEWVGDIATCSLTCGGGVYTRNRTITQEPDYEGETCPDTEETTPCYTQQCPIDCVMNDWSDWGACSASCGSGTQARYRSIQISGAYGGRTCPVQGKEEDKHEFEQTQSCDLDPCPVHCELSSWADWSDCSQTCIYTHHHKNAYDDDDIGNQNGVRVKTRVVEIAQDHGGDACPLRDVTFPQPYDAKQLDANDHDYTGVRQTQVQVGLNDAYTEVESCDESVTPKCPIDCQLGEWEDDTPCSLTCWRASEDSYNSAGILVSVQISEKGHLWRKRVVKHSAMFGGEECPTPGSIQVSKLVECSDMPYCAQDCEVSPWEGDPNMCSATCQANNFNTPTYKATRKMLIPMRNGGKECPELETQLPCNTQPCPSTTEAPPESSTDVPEQTSTSTTTTVSTAQNDTNSTQDEHNIIFTDPTTAEPIDLLRNGTEGVVNDTVVRNLDAPEEDCNPWLIVLLLLLICPLCGGGAYMMLKAEAVAEPTFGELQKAERAKWSARHLEQHERKLSLEAESFGMDHGVAEHALTTAGFTPAFTKKLLDQITARDLSATERLARPETETDRAILQKLKKKIRNDGGKKGDNSSLYVLELREFFGRKIKEMYKDDLEAAVADDVVELLTEKEIQDMLKAQGFSAPTAEKLAPKLQEKMILESSPLEMPRASAVEQAQAVSGFFQSANTKSGKSAKSLKGAQNMSMRPANEQPMHAVLVAPIFTAAEIDALGLQDDKEKQLFTQNFKPHKDLGNVEASDELNLFLAKELANRGYGEDFLQANAEALLTAESLKQLEFFDAIEEVLKMKFTPETAKKLAKQTLDTFLNSAIMTVGLEFDASKVEQAERILLFSPAETKKMKQRYEQYVNNLRKTGTLPAGDSRFSQLDAEFALLERTFGTGVSYDKYNLDRPPTVNVPTAEASTLNKAIQERLQKLISAKRERAASQSTSSTFSPELAAAAAPTTAEVRNEIEKALLDQGFSEEFTRQMGLAETMELKLRTEVKTLQNPSINVKADGKASEVHLFEQGGGRLKKPVQRGSSFQDLGVAKEEKASISVTGSAEKVHVIQGFQMMKPIKFKFDDMSEKDKKIAQKDFIGHTSFEKQLEKQMHEKAKRDIVQERISLDLGQVLNEEPDSDGKLGVDVDDSEPEGPTSVTIKMKDSMWTGATSGTSGTVSGLSQQLGLSSVKSAQSTDSSGGSEMDSEGKSLLKKKKKKTTTGGKKTTSKTSKLSSKAVGSLASDASQATTESSGSAEESGAEDSEGTGLLGGTTKTKKKKKIVHKKKPSVKPKTTAASGTASSEESGGEEDSHSHSGESAGKKKKITKKGATTKKKKTENKGPQTAQVEYPDTGPEPTGYTPGPPELTPQEVMMREAEKALQHIGFGKGTAKRIAYAMATTDDGENGMKLTDSEKQIAVKGFTDTAKPGGKKKVYKIDNLKDLVDTLVAEKPEFFANSLKPESRMGNKKQGGETGKNNKQVMSLLESTFNA